MLSATEPPQQAAAGPQGGTPAGSRVAGRVTAAAGGKAEASDGHIGKVDEDTEEVGASYIVVDTSPWIFASLAPSRLGE